MTMAIRIDGTNTSAAPGITGADTDTGLQFGTDEVKIVTGATDRVKVDSTGRLLVNTAITGTNASNAPLQIGSSVSAWAINLRTRTGSNDYAYLGFSSADSNEPLANIFARRTAQNKGYLAFDTNDGNASAAEKMRIHSGGEVTKSSQPAFMAALNANSAVSSGIGKVKDRITAGHAYTNVSINTGSCYDSSNTVFTAPVDGVYVFSNQIATSSDMAANSYLGAEFYKNGSRISMGWRRSHSQGYQRVTANIILDLSASDTIEPGIETAAAGTILGGSSGLTQYTHFLGYLLH